MKRIYALSSFLILFFFTGPLMGQLKEIESYRAGYYWDLTPLYSTDEMWSDEKQVLDSAINELSVYKGSLTSSSQSLEMALQHFSNLRKDATRLWTYAILNADRDTRVAKYQSMVETSLMIYNKLYETSSFIAPEILETDEAIIQGFLNDNKKLEEHRFYLEDLLRKKAHFASREEEIIIANVSIMDENTTNVFNVLMNADFPHRNVTLSTGEEVELNQSNFSLHRGSANREDRKLVMENFFGGLNSFQNTLGTSLYGNLKREVFYTKVRNYNSSLELTLDEHNIPVELYHNLIEVVNNNLGTFHRYLNLRKRMMGLDQLHYYDLYAPLLEEGESYYPIEEAKKIIVASLKPLGKDYIKMIHKAFDEDWIDLYPSKGKKSGAYSSGLAYDVHPYVLINYNNTHGDVSTLTHELGHALHTHYSNQNQPFTLAHYPIFVAEVASTFNEALLDDYFLKHADNPTEKLLSMGNFMENAKSQLFRAVQFAEFELTIHELALEGEALSGEKFSEIFEEITKKYYGHDQGICFVDDFVKNEWAFISHFYRSFYQYQYATSFIASQALSEKVISGEKGATKKYLHFLTTGGSAYPVDLLKEAGIDLTSEEPYEITFLKLNNIMDEMEKILDQME